MLCRVALVHQAVEKGKHMELARQWTFEMWRNALWSETRWMGAKVLQWPTDLLIMQELIWTTKPDFIVETGSAAGGSALFYASIFELLGHGQVIFENSLGGRVAIVPWLANTGLHGTKTEMNVQRATQLAKTLTWLASGNHPGSVEGGPWLIPQFLTNGHV